MADITTVHVDYRKLVSDREYGNEQASLSLTATLVAGDHPDEVARDLHKRAPTLVLAQLKQSVSPSIRDAVETDEDREHEDTHEPDL